MFSRCIRSRIHPATWAVIGLKHDKKKPGQGQAAHRGTAFAVDASGHLLTCWHVAFMDQDCKVLCDEFIVVQPSLGSPQYPARLVASEKDRDVALLEIVDRTVRTSPVRLLGTKVGFGRSCCAFGHPLSVTDPKTQSIRIFTRATAGVVSMAHDAGRFAGSRPVSLYELDFFAHGGLSGGPVFRRNGDVFAIVSGSLPVDDGKGNLVKSNLTVAMDVREAIEFLKPLNVKPKVRRSIWR